MRSDACMKNFVPLRDPLVSGPDDPGLTILVLTRVIEQLGDLEMITTHEIEGLFAVDLAFLQDFYGVINFGTQEEYEALLQAQQDNPLVGGPPAAEQQSPAADTPPAAEEPSPSAEPGRPSLRTAVEELPRRAL